MTAALKQTAPVPKPRRISARALLAEGEKRVDVQGLIEAGNKYGDDVDRELADIQAGEHPLQRPKRERYA